MHSVTVDMQLTGDSAGAGAGLSAGRSDMTLVSTRSCLAGGRPDCSLCPVAVS